MTLSSSVRRRPLGTGALQELWSSSSPSLRTGRETRARDGSSSCRLSSPRERAEGQSLVSSATVSRRMGRVSGDLSDGAESTRITRLRALKTIGDIHAEQIKRENYFGYVSRPGGGGGNSRDDACNSFSRLRKKENDKDRRASPTSSGGGQQRGTSRQQQAASPPATAAVVQSISNSWLRGDKKGGIGHKVQKCMQHVQKAMVTAAAQDDYRRAYHDSEMTPSKQRSARRQRSRNNRDDEDYIERNQRGNNGDEEVGSCRFSFNNCSLQEGEEEREGGGGEDYIIGDGMALPDVTLGEVTADEESNGGHHHDATAAVVGVASVSSSSSAEILDAQQRYESAKLRKETAAAVTATRTMHVIGGGGGGGGGGLTSSAEFSTGASSTNPMTSSPDLVKEETIQHRAKLLRSPCMDNVVNNNPPVSNGGGGGWTSPSIRDTEVCIPGQVKKTAQIFENMSKSSHVDDSSVVVVPAVSSPQFFATDRSMLPNVHTPNPPAMDSTVTEMVKFNTANGGDDDSETQEINRATNAPRFGSSAIEDSDEVPIVQNGTSSYSREDLSSRGRPTTTRSSYSREDRPTTVASPSPRRIGLLEGARYMLSGKRTQRRGDQMSSSSQHKVDDDLSDDDISEIPPSSSLSGDESPLIGTSPFPSSPQFVVEKQGQPPPSVPPMPPNTTTAANAKVSMYPPSPSPASQANNTRALLPSAARPPRPVASKPPPLPVDDNRQYLVPPLSDPYYQQSGTGPPSSVLPMYYHNSEGCRPSHPSLGYYDIDNNTHPYHVQRQQLNHLAPPLPQYLYHQPDYMQNFGPPMLPPEYHQYMAQQGRPHLVMLPSPPPPSMTHQLMMNQRPPSLSVIQPWGNGANNNNYGPSIKPLEPQSEPVVKKHPTDARRSSMPPRPPPKVSASGGGPNPSELSENRSPQSIGPPQSADTSCRSHSSQTVLNYNPVVTDMHTQKCPPNLSASPSRQPSPQPANNKKNEPTDIMPPSMDFQRWRHAALQYEPAPLAKTWGPEFRSAATINTQAAFADPMKRAIVQHSYTNFPPDAIAFRLVSLEDVQIIRPKHTRSNSRSSGSNDDYFGDAISYTIVPSFRGHITEEYAETPAIGPFTKAVLRSQRTATVELGEDLLKYSYGGFRYIRFDVFQYLSMNGESCLSSKLVGSAKLAPSVELGDTHPFKLTTQFCCQSATIRSRPIVSEENIVMGSLLLAVTLTWAVPGESLYPSIEDKLDAVKQVAALEQPVLIDSHNVFWSSSSQGGGEGSSAVFVPRSSNLNFSAVITSGSDEEPVTKRQQAPPAVVRQSSERLVNGGSMMPPPPSPAAPPVSVDRTRSSSSKVDGSHRRSMSLRASSSSSRASRRSPGLSCGLFPSSNDDRLIPRGGPPKSSSTVMRGSLNSSSGALCSGEKSEAEEMFDVVGFGPDGVTTETYATIGREHKSSSGGAAVAAGTQVYKDATSTQNNNNSNSSSTRGDSIEDLGDLFNYELLAQMSGPIPPPISWRQRRHLCDRQPPNNNPLLKLGNGSSPLNRPPIRTRNSPASTFERLLSTVKGFCGPDSDDRNSNLPTY